MINIDTQKLSQAITNASAAIRQALAMRAKEES
jgi:hypothetical protein